MPTPQLEKDGTRIHFSGLSPSLTSSVCPQVSCSPAHQGSEELGALLTSPCLVVGMRWGCWPGALWCREQSRKAHPVTEVAQPGAARTRLEEQRKG